MKIDDFIEFIKNSDNFLNRELLKKAVKDIKAIWSNLTYALLSGSNNEIITKDYLLDKLDTIKHYQNLPVMEIINKIPLDSKRREIFYSIQENIENMVKV